MCFLCPRDFQQLLLNDEHIVDKRIETEHKVIPLGIFYYILYFFYQRSVWPETQSVTFDIAYPDVLKIKTIIVVKFIYF